MENFRTVADGEIFGAAYEVNKSKFLAHVRHVEDEIAAREFVQTIKKKYFDERFLLAGVDPDNYLVQKISTTERRVRVIDNIGIASLVPLPYYFDYFALKRGKKYWRRFVNLIRTDYGKIFSKEFLNKLAKL